MASQKDVKNRIASVKNIAKITRAMEMVAAARLRRAEQRIEALRPYARAIRRMTRRTVEAAENIPNLPILQERESVNRVGSAARHRRPRPGGRVQLPDHPRRQPPGAGAAGRGQGGPLVRLRAPRRVLARVPRPRGLGLLAGLHRPPRLLRRPRHRQGDIATQYIDGKVDRVEIIYNGYVSPLTQEVVTTDGCCRSRTGGSCSAEDEDATRRRRRASEESGEIQALWIYEPDPEEILARLVPDYVEISIYRALLESTASEHGARMTAMRSAQENANEHDRRPDPRDEPPAPGGDHAGDHGSRRRRRRASLAKGEWKPWKPQTEGEEEGGDGQRRHRRGDHGRGDRGGVRAGSPPRDLQRARDRDPLDGGGRRAHEARARGAAAPGRRPRARGGHGRHRRPARGTEIRDTGGPITVPVGKGHAGPHLQPARRADRRRGRRGVRGALADPPRRARRRGPHPHARDLRDRHQGRGPAGALRQGRQGRPVRRRRRGQDGADPGADPQPRPGARRPVGVLRRGRALARGQRPLARDDRVGRDRQDHARVRPDERAARRAHARRAVRPDDGGVLPRRRAARTCCSSSTTSSASCRRAPRCRRCSAACPRRWATSPRWRPRWASSRSGSPRPARARSPRSRPSTCRPTTSPTRPRRRCSPT